MRSASVAGDRWFALRVYRRSPSGFVPVIEYCTTDVPDQQVTFAEVVDRLEDVENFFGVFEPSELFTDQMWKSMPIEERRRLTKSILRLYDVQVDSVLLAVQTYAFDVSVEKTAAGEAGGKHKNSLLK